MASTWLRLAECLPYNLIIGYHQTSAVFRGELLKSCYRLRKNLLLWHSLKIQAKVSNSRSHDERVRVDVPASARS